MGMLRMLVLVAAGLWAAAGCIVTPGHAADAPGAAPDLLAARLEQSLAHRGLSGAALTVLVVRESDGAVLFARNPDRALVPASNQKILTALAALATWGGSHQFVTRIYSDRPPDAEGRVGWLAVQGGGDPTLTSEQLWRLAADLRRAGLRHVQSGVILDDSAFDRVYWNPAWGDVTSRAYYAPVGALSANYGAFALEARPGAAAGAPLAAELDPPVDFLTLHNAGRTGRPGSAPALVVGREAVAGHDRVDVSGTLAADDESRVFYRSVSDPTRYAGSVLRLQLAAVGVRVDGDTSLAAVPADSHLLLEFEGRPLAEVVRLFVKYSNNGIAEALLKDMGREATGEPGSWPNGLAALGTRLRELGLDTNGARLVDGSGLARGNRVSARLLVSALRRAQQSFVLGPELVVALPVAARDGTLEKRAGAAALRVRAKTGLLDGVTGLSGFACNARHGQVVFSVLANDYVNGDQSAMDALDGFVATLVGATGGPDCQDAAREALR